MAKGALITNEVETLIAKVYQEHPKWRAREVRNWVSSILRKGKPELPTKWPSLSAVQKVLTTVRRNASEVDPQEKPWSMATLDEYPIPPEAIHAVLRVWESRMQSKSSSIIREANKAAQLSGFLEDQGLDSASKKSLMTSKADFTIREAKWAARLSGLIADTQGLEFWSSTYASGELLSQLIARPFDSTALDRQLMGLPLDYTDVQTYLLNLVRQDGATATMEQIRHHWSVMEAKKKGGKLQ